MIDYLGGISLGKNDYELSNIMTAMERKYNIPSLRSNLVDWMKRTEHAKDILEMYCKFSNMRDI